MRQAGSPKIVNRGGRLASIVAQNETGEQRCIVVVHRCLGRGSQGQPNPLIGGTQRVASELIANRLDPELSDHMANLCPTWMTGQPDSGADNLKSLTDRGICQPTLCTAVHPGVIAMILDFERHP